MGWFDQLKNPKIKSPKKSGAAAPSGLWKKCPACSEIIQTSKLVENFQVCPYCEEHFRLTVNDRIDLLFDKGSFQTFDDDFRSIDPLNFFDKRSYKDRLTTSIDKTGYQDAVVLGVGMIDQTPVSAAIMNFEFMGGSMGVVAGEKIAKAMDMAFHKNIACLVISSSGGARMQEGILSLMQMAKTSTARKRLKVNGIPYISLLTDPTTGGAAASFSMQGDINIAEPKALIGFAGPRVIEQSIREKLPEGFQRSEFLLEHGFIDRIIHRKNLKSEIGFFIKMFSKKSDEIH